MSSSIMETWKPCAGFFSSQRREEQWAACWRVREYGREEGRESHDTTGQHSPLSRGLREFTESRRPLPPRRGRACCSSFAVHRPPVFNPSPASGNQVTPKSSKWFWKRRRSRSSQQLNSGSAPVRGDQWGRLGERGWMGVSGETYRGGAGMARERERRGGRGRRVADGGKSNLLHLLLSFLFPGSGKVRDSRAVHPVPPLY